MKDKTQIRIWIACSGGIDSVVLAHILSSQGYNTALLHCNFHLRGNESDEDELFVTSYAHKLNIPIEVKHFNTPELVKKHDGNTQIVAREIRYNWFKEIAIRDNALIALGHHQDDQVETFLIQLERGGGIRGLCAMKRKQGFYLRPLLNKNRSWILNYANENNLAWREDSSNASIKYKRNFYRHLILPKMKKNGAYEEVLLLINDYQNLQEKIQTQTRILVKEFLQNNFIKSKTWNCLSSLEQKEILYQLEIPRNQTSEISKLANASKGGKIDYQNISLVNDGDGLLISKKEQPKLAKLKTESVDILEIDYSKKNFFIDKEKVKGELKLRPWQAGDRYTPLGLKGSKRISKYLNGLSINSVEKQNAFVILDDEKIVAVEHGAPSELVKIDTNTKEVLRLTILK